MSRQVESWSKAEQELMVECQRLQAICDKNALVIQRLKLAVVGKNKTIVMNRQHIKMLEKMNGDLLKAVSGKPVVGTKIKKSTKKTKKSNTTDTIMKEIEKVKKKVIQKSGNTVPFETLNRTVSVKELKVYLSKCKKIEKITDAINSHKKEMAKRGAEQVQYDVGCVMRKFPDLKLVEIRKYLKKDLPKTKKAKKKPKKKSMVNVLKSRK